MHEQRNMDQTGEMSQANADGKPQMPELLLATYASIGRTTALSAFLDEWMERFRRIRFAIRDEEADLLLPTRLSADDYASGLHILGVDCIDLLGLAIAADVRSLGHSKSKAENVSRAFVDEAQRYRPQFDEWLRVTVTKWFECSPVLCGVDGIAALNTHLSQRTHLGRAAVYLDLCGASKLLITEYMIQAETPTGMSVAVFRAGQCTPEFIERFSGVVRNAGHAVRGRWADDNYIACLLLVDQIGENAMKQLLNTSGVHRSGIAKVIGAFFSHKLPFGALKLGGVVLAIAKCSDTRVVSNGTSVQLRPQMAAALDAFLVGLGESIVQGKTSEGLMTIPEFSAVARSARELRQVCLSMQEVVEELR